MDADQIRNLEPDLMRFLKRFDDCFTRPQTRAHLATYVRGQLSDLGEKSCEPIALAAGVPPRNLQEFLSAYAWDEDLARRRLQECVMRDDFGPHALGVFDETSDVKQGTKTPGVQRQWCGTRGKTENCIVTVHLGYATGDFHCLVDGDLFLPQSWSDDRDRCRAAGIPDDVVYRPKWRIALELLDRARANGMRFSWLTFDEGYGGKPEFLRELTARGEVFVGEVPKTFTGWIRPPRVTRRPFRRGRGRGRKTPRLRADSRPAISLEKLLRYSPELRDAPWARYRVKDGEKGPMVWEAKRARITVQDESGLPGACWHLVVARNVLDRDEIKFFLSNAAPEAAVSTLLLVGFSRWRVERCFEDQKQEVGLDQWEGRRWLGLKRHLIITSISYLFLARTQRRLRGEKSGRHGMPDPRRDGGVDTELAASRGARRRTDREGGRNHPALAAPHRRGPHEPCPSYPAKTAPNGHLSQRPHPL
jgi:SRSO17 transposase